MGNKQKPIVIKKIHRLETNLIVILLGILVLSVGIVWIGYSNNKIKALESSVEKSLTTSVSVDKNEISYYRELSNKTDAAIERIIMIVGSFSAILSLFGLILAFRVPMEIKQKIDEVRELAEVTSDKTQCQLEVFSAINFDVYQYSSEISKIWSRINKLSKIIKQYPDKSVAYAYMARAIVYEQLAWKYKQLNSPNDNRYYDYCRLAIGDYFSALDVGADVGVCNNNIGKIYYNLDKKSEALKYYNEVIKKNPRNKECLINRGFCYESLGDFELSLNDFNKALQIDNMEVSAYYGRSRAYQGLSHNNVTEQDKYRSLERQDLEKGIEIDPNYLPVKERLSELNATVENIIESSEEKRL